jgi:hypothetical protein
MEQIALESVWKRVRDRDLEVNHKPHVPDIEARCVENALILSPASGSGIFAVS